MTNAYIEFIQRRLSEVETLGIFLHTSILALLDASIHFSYVILIAIFHSLRIQVSIFNYALLLKEKEVDFLDCFLYLLFISCRQLWAFQRFLKTGRLEGTFWKLGMEWYHVNHIIRDTFWLLLKNLSLRLRILLRCVLFESIKSFCAQIILGTPRTIWLKCLLINFHIHCWFFLFLIRIRITLRWFIGTIFFLFLLHDASISPWRIPIVFFHLGKNSSALHVCR